ncbi:MAG: AsmA-like C-terminal region-containing protein [Propionivibrio sp.]
MDSNLIYVKTASGEEAMHQRTRVMQRNLRMVLILVNGKSTVSDLVLKIGNPQLTESALAELEAGGFVAPQVEQDSLWSESKKVAQEIRSAALNKAIQVMSPDKGETKAPEIDRERILATDSAFSQSAFPFPPMPFSTADRPVVAPVAEKTRKAKKLPVKNSDVFTKFVRQVKGVFSSGKPTAQPEAFSKPIRRRGRKSSLTWSAVVTLAFLFLVVLSALVVTFFPYDLFRPDVEAAIARSTGQPVTIGGIHGEIYPKPGLLLTDIRFGKEGRGLSIAEASLWPELGSVLKQKIGFRQVVLSGVSLPVESIGGLQQMFASLAAPTSGFGLKSVRFEKTELSFAGLALSGLEGDAQRNAAGSFEGLQLHAADRGINLVAKVAGAGVEMNLDALAWRPSEASRFVVNGANLKGVFENGALTLSEMELRIFDGLVKGVAVLRADKARSLVGEIMYERIDASRFGETLGIGQFLAGSASGSLRFSALSEHWTTIFSVMDADGAFSLDRGSVRGIDLPEAVRRVSRGPVQGGATQFEQLSGKIKVGDSGYRISDIRINSGLMQSTGNAEVSKDLKLKGRMELQMRGTANQMRVPVSLGGTLMVPEVRAANN